jgi:hypothetical protein
MTTIYESRFLLKRSKSRMWQLAEWKWEKEKIIVLGVE